MVQCLTCGFYYEATSEYSVCPCCGEPLYLDFENYCIREGIECLQENKH